MARNPRRYLAPIALVAVIVAIVLVVSSGLGSSRSGASHTVASHTRASHHGRGALTVHAPANNNFYVVRSGDSLSTISVKTGISVPTLESLNPSVDPNALQTGQRLRLR